MRKLINNPINVVREMLEGMADLNPNLAILENENVIIRSNSNKSEVVIISGGGSGHEPAHAGYVGDGMLHAAVAGDVFTSPSSDAVLSAILAVAGAKGALLIVKNYTGDRLNFGLAAELARAQGIPVEVVVVADDIALLDRVSAERSRGVAGTIFVHKIAGAVAASGADLASVAKAAREAATQVATMGVALGSCTIPAVGKPSFELPDGEVELGLGIHGEKGLERIANKTADELVDILINKIVVSLKLNQTDKIALLVNGLGGTTLMELAIVSRAALAKLRLLGFNVARAWSGTFMSALEMPGVSLSILKLNDHFLDYLDYPVNIPTWNGNGIIPQQRIIIPQININDDEIKPQLQASSPLVYLQQIIVNIALELENAEPLLTKLDSLAGDGDLGMSMTRGAKALRQLPDYAYSCIGQLLISSGEALRKAIAGSSGPFYATALLRAGRYLADLKSISPHDFAEAFLLAANSVAELGGAKLDDRTMLDALLPAALTFKQSIVDGLSQQQALSNAVTAAEIGAATTAKMRPKLGRASYLGNRVIGVPDGGAIAVSIWLKALLTA